MCIAYFDNETEFFYLSQKKTNKNRHKYINIFRLAHEPYIYAFTSIVINQFIFYLYLSTGRQQIRN